MTITAKPTLEEITNLTNRYRVAVAHSEWCDNLPVNDPQAANKYRNALMEERKAREALDIAIRRLTY